MSVDSVADMNIIKHLSDLGGGHNHRQKERKKDNKKEVRIRKQG